MSTYFAKGVLASNLGTARVDDEKEGKSMRRNLNLYLFL